MTQIGYVLALHRRLNLTALRYQKLQAYFKGDWQMAYQAKLPDWQAAGVDPRGIEKFFAAQERFSPATELEFMQSCVAQVITIDDSDYPRAWQSVPQAPALLFVRGNPDHLNAKAIAVVGARKMTPYGERVLQKLLKPVFEAKPVIVSGLAFGVDAAAHQLALACDAPTVAVLGSGIDTFYPRSNQSLGDNILASGGTVISEYLPHSEVRAENFPTRNRLVAGLAQATVVVEGAEKSGSLITARLANEFGKEVWAVPGDVFRAGSAGCNQLIAHGEAAPLISFEILLESLNLKSATSWQKVHLSNEEKALVKVLGSRNQWSLSEFLEQFDAPAAQVGGTLTLLELKGVVQKRGEQVFLS